MKILLSFFLLFPAIFLFGQSDTTYYFGVNGNIQSINKAEIKMVFNYKNQDRFNIDIFNFNHEKWQKKESETVKVLNSDSYSIVTKKGEEKSSYIRTYADMGNGRWQFVETKQQQVLRRGTTLQKMPLILDGVVTQYYPNGPIMSESVYKNNELISNKNWLENGIPYFENLFYSVDQYPDFSKGNEQLNQYILKKLTDNRIDFSKVAGQLEIGFVVFENGQIGGFKVLKSISPYLEELVINAFRELQGEWIPANLNGENVRFFQTYPINFEHHEFLLESFDYYNGLVQFDRK